MKLDKALLLDLRRRCIQHEGQGYIDPSLVRFPLGAVRTVLAAAELLCEAVEYEPWVPERDKDAQHVCFFCGREKPLHDRHCPYEEAKALGAA